LLLSSKLSLNRVKAALDHLPDKVRRHEIHTASPLGESLADAL
jgi:hypothetical protein